MTLVELFKGSHVSLGSPLGQRVVRRLRCLGFGCGHVSPARASQEGFYISLLVRHDHHASASFKGAALSSLSTPWGAVRGLSSALNAGVMQRFERVVALPDPKKLCFSQPNQQLRQFRPLMSPGSGQMNDNQPLRL